MRKIWRIINYCRSIPAVWMYKHLPCKKEIQNDLIHTDELSLFELHTAIMDSPLFRKIFYFRTTQYFPFLTKVSKLFWRPFPTMELHADSIGGGMKIYHGYSSVVFAKSIGENFAVYQQVTIGRGKMINGRDIPIIGDNVTVYAGAIVVGGINIGNNVTIGAGAVVTKDVPDNTTVVGAPMRVYEK